MEQTLLQKIFHYALLMTLLMCIDSSAWGQSTQRVRLGSAAHYGLLSATTITAQNAPIQVQGKAGAGENISSSVAATAGRFALGGGTVPQALVDLQRAQSQCNSLGGPAAITLSSALAGSSLTGGVYTSTGAASLSSGGTLTIAGDTNTVVIINVAGNLSLQANSRMVLSGVLPQHVFWNVSGSLHVANGAAFAGVALLAGPATLEGSQFGACAILSHRDITLTRISALIGHNRFFAPLRPASFCASSNPCSFTRPGSELVRDGSFEVMRCCPPSLGGLEVFSTTTYEVVSNACFWRDANGASPDYYHACDTSPTNYSVGVPVNQMTTNQQVPALAQNSQALTGQAYAGAIMYSVDTNTAPPHQVSNEGPGGEEIAQVLTGVVLQPGRRYYGEFSAYLTQLSRYSVPQIGMALTTISIPAAPGTFLSATPVVSGDPNLPIPSGAPVGTPIPRGWKRVGQVFQLTAPMGQTGQPTPALVIGSFNGMAHNDNGGGPGFDTGSQHTDQAYYFIDNVSLSPLTEAGPNQELTMTCNGSVAPTVVLGTAPMPALVEATYQWTASPADPSLTAGAAQTANPTVSPTQTTTYSLAVTINGTTYAPSSATITILNSRYQQNPPATYVAMGKARAYEVGTGGAGTTTTIDASQAPYGAATGNTVVFDGVYHVQGNLLLTGGTFVLNPGTIFFIDGYGHEMTDNQRISIRVRDGQLRLDGAMLRATCNELYQGIVLERNATLTTASAQGHRSLIRDAQWAVWRSWDTAGGVSLENHYYLTDTDFLNNITSIIDGLRLSGQPHDVITGCTFKTDQVNSPLMMELYRKQYRAAGIFFYDYSEHYAALTPQPLQITNCAFDQLAVGVSGSSAGTTVANCTFTNCWYAALASQSFRYGYGSADPARQDMLVQNNHITLPQYLPFAYAIIGGSAPNPAQTQYPYAYDTSTLTSTYGINFHDGITISNNVFDMGGINASRVSVPVGISLTYNGTATGNKLADLTRGIQATSGDSFNGTSYTFSQNTFTNNDAGVVFTPGITPDYGWTVPAPQVGMRCNTFSGNTGVWVQPDTRFPATMGNNNSPSGPNGNNFSGVTNGTSASSPSGKKFVYEGANSFLYWGYNSAQEFQITTAPTDFQGNGNGHYDSNYTPTSATCGGPSAPGVYNFTGPVATTSPDATQRQQDSLKLGLTAPQQQALLTRVLHNYQPAATYDDLETYLHSLVQTKPEVYKWATFALLQAYDYTDRPADAQRLRQTLTTPAATDTELLSQLRLQEVRGHLCHQHRTLPGSDPTAADLALLRLAAAPNTPAGRQACQFLQAYEPACACTQNLTTRYTPVARQPAPATPDAVSILGEAHPNPATEQVSFSYQLPATTPAANLVVYNLLGQRVTTQPVRASLGELTFSVNTFPAGLYLAVLETNGHRLATRKLLVIH